MPKLLEIDQNNLGMKFSVQNVDFSSLSFDPLGSRSSLYGYPIQNALLLHVVH